MRRISALYLAIAVASGVCAQQPLHAAARHHPHKVQRAALAHHRVRLGANPISAFQTYVNAYIIPNAQGNITGAVMNQALNYLVPAFTSMGSWDNTGAFTLSANALPLPLGCAALPALTGDVTSTAGACATTVTRINGTAAGTAATTNTGTSGHNIPFLDGVNTWSGAQAFPGGLIGSYGTLPGSGTNGQIFTTSGGFYAFYNGVWNGPFSATGINSTQPTNQKFLTAGSGTYTTPGGVSWIRIVLQGPGAGGGGGGTGGGNGGAGSPTCWNTSGSACVTPLFSAGGGAGGGGSNTNGSAGGTISGSGTCYRAIPGGAGGGGNTSISGSIPGLGGLGGVGALGGGSANFVGPAANSGSGGSGGASGNGVSATAGAGGGAGAYCEVIINSPAPSYTYTVGAIGAAGSAGTGGNAGLAGALGGIWVEEHYNP